MVREMYEQLIAWVNNLICHKTDDEMATVTRVKVPKPKPTMKATTR
jgi:hypothetical protein